MIEQTPVEKEKEEEQPKEEPAPAISTNVVGNGGPGGFNVGHGGGNVIGNKGNGGSARSRWGWYACQVQAKVTEALKSNKRTRSASMNLKVRVWSDASGRITRSAVAGSSGNSDVDNALKNEVLTGLALNEPPPAGMPMPIVLQVVARRTN